SPRRPTRRRFKRRAMTTARLCGLLLLAAALLASDAMAYDAKAPFERALAVRRQSLGPADTKPISYKEVRCFYFAGLMVKEIDEREIGDKQISYLPLAPGQAKPACSATPLVGEQSVALDELTAYFWGAAANTLFLT